MSDKYYKYSYCTGTYYRLNPFSFLRRLLDQIKNSYCGFICSNSNDFPHGTVMRKISVNKLDRDPLLTNHLLKAVRRPRGTSVFSCEDSNGLILRTVVHIGDI